MTTKKAIIILSASVVVALLLITRFGTRLPFGKGGGNNQPKILEIGRPATRPDRADLAMFSQFDGKTMGQIFNSLKPVQEIKEQTAAEALARSLPKEPFPFSGSTQPVNDIALKEFTERIESGTLGKPDMVDRWRYNLASSALGKPDEEIPADLRLKLKEEPETENFPVTLVPRESQLEGALTVGDFDLSTPGLEIVSHGGTRMWAVGENGLTELPGLNGGIRGEGLRPADFDNDGDLDLFIFRRHGHPNSLLQNDGNGGFIDVTGESGLVALIDTAVAEWIDYDQDGLLDLAVGNYDHPFEIYRQYEPGSFKPVSWDLGLWFPQGVTDILVADINRDYNPDLFLSVNQNSGHLLLSIPSTNPENWRFLDKSAESKLPLRDSQFVFAAIDFDNDGDLDLLIGNSAGEESEKLISTALNSYDTKVENHLKLFMNDGEGVFAEVTEGSGLEHVQDVRALHVMDIDNDGFEDVFAITGDLIFNRAFWNRGGMRFRDISEGSQFSYLDSPEELLSIDLDSDGAMDFFLSEKGEKTRWLECEGLLNGWVELNLPGNIPGSRISAVSRDTDWILQPIHRTTGQIPRVTLGLGQVDKVEKIQVFLPGSSEADANLKNVKPNQSLNVTLPERKRTSAKPSEITEEEEEENPPS